jgi:hypothetical protein
LWSLSIEEGKKKRFVFNARAQTEVVIVLWQYQIGTAKCRLTTNFVKPKENHAAIVSAGLSFLMFLVSFFFLFGLL